MINTDIDYWLYFESYVYCESNKYGVMLYNTLDGNFIESQDYIIIELINSIFSNENYGVILFNKERFKNHLYTNFIYEIREKYIGDIIPVEISYSKPIQLIPLLNLQRDIDKNNQKEAEFTEKGVLNYLNSISLYINNKCQQVCENCTFLYRQSSCCTKSEVHNDLPISMIKNILDQCRHVPLNNINIIGGNIFMYHEIKKLTEILNINKKIVSFWNHYLNCDFVEISILECFLIEIIVTFPIVEDIFIRFIEFYKKRTISYNFYISNLDEFNQSEFLINKYLIEYYRIKPIYNKTNHLFFSENIFIDKKDIFSSVIEQKRIFANQKINTNFFGKLTVLANGNVYANINSCAIGNIHKDTILDIVNTEMKINTAWRKIRDTAPCLDCLYQFLCPSPSNYELVIGKPNLCHIKL